jgi:acid phosphatase class B
MPIKTAFSMLSLLVCGFSVHAQVSATLSHLPDGSTEFKIKNNAAVDLVAYEMIANAADGKHAPFVASSDLTGSYDRIRKSPLRVLSRAAKVGI